MTKHQLYQLMDLCSARIVKFEQSILLQNFSKKEKGEEREEKGEEREEKGEEREER